MGKITVLIIEESDQELLDEIFKLTEKTKKRKNRRSDLIRFEGLEVREREKSVYLDGKEIRLSKIEYLILHHLVSHPMWVQSKHQIFEAVWPPEAEADYHTVEVMIHSIRKKIDPDITNPRFIKTVHGHGYKFIGKKII